MGQYRGGREEGRKNLKKKGDKLINQNGVAFTKEEKKELERLVNRATYKRNKMIDFQKELPYFIGGRPTGFAIGEIPSFIGRENDFVLTKKSKSLQRFNNHEEYERYINYLKDAVSKDYIGKRIEEYKKNHIKSIKEVFNSKGQELADKIAAMPNDEYLKMISSDETLTIDYIDSDQDENEYVISYKRTRDEQLKTINFAFERYTEREKATTSPDEIYNSITEGKMSYRRGRRKK